jgi:hypothetical protein
VVVDVLVPQNQAEDPLFHQRLDPMLGIARVAPVAEALGKPTYKPKAAIHLAQQQTTRIRGDVPAIKAGHQPTLVYRFKFEQLRRTLCMHRGPPPDLIKAFSQNNFLRFVAPMHCSRLRNSG